MFSFREFLKKGFLSAVGNMADYKIILNASGYYEKGVLTAEDLAEISAKIDEHNAAVTEEVAEEATEEEEKREE